MKRLPILCFLCTLIIALSWCNVDTRDQISWDEERINHTISNTIHEHENCESRWTWDITFVSYTTLWTWINSEWNLEYYITTEWQWFYIDERWNLSNSCWFAWIPTTIEFSANWSWYEVIRYQQAMDGNLYVSSTKEMFSKEAFNKRQSWDYEQEDTNFLASAEEHFNVKVEPKSDFECKFCDRTWWFEKDEDFKNTNDLKSYYTLQQTSWKSFIFNSDGTFETKWSRDEWKWTRSFGQDEYTVVVTNEKTDHVYDRYIIEPLTDNSISIITEIIQKR